MRFETYASPNFPRQTVILPEFSPNSDVNFTLLAALIGHPAFGKPEVSLEQYRGWHAIFQVSKNFTRVFTQFHAISRNFHAIWAISAIFGPISTCWVSKSMYSSWEIHWWHFHTSSCTWSHNFIKISHNLGYFGHFWANFNMLGIKKHVLQLRNSLVVLGEVIGHQIWPDH